MTGDEREAFARGVSVGCAFGFAVGSERAGDTDSTAAELVRLLDDLDRLRQLCGTQLTPVEMVRAALVDRLAETATEANVGCA